MIRPSRRPSLRWRSVAVLVGAALIVGCAAKPKEEGKAPGAGLGDLNIEPTAGEGTQKPGATPTAKVKNPGARDRDPEEEKRKMAASRKQSAAAEKALRGGQLDAAVVSAREALMTHEQNAEAMLVMAEVFHRRGNHELVLAVTASVLQIDAKVLLPADASRAHNLKGFAFLAAKNQEAAFTSFRKAAEADDKNAAAWNNLGAQYLRIGDAKTAIDCFLYATSLDPGFFKAHLNLGSAYRASRAWAKADAAYRQALKLRASYPEAYFNLGVLYLDADPYPGLATTARLQKAIDSFSRYRELSIAAGTGDGERLGDDVASARKGKGKGKSKKKKKRNGVVAEPPSAVSIAQADLYVEIATKGIEREAKRKERGQKRRDAEAKNPEPAAASAPSKPAPEAPEGEPTGKPGAAQQPGAQKPGAQKPGAQTPGAQKPGAQKPGAQTPGAQKPGAQKPGAQKPAAQKPGAQKPAAPVQTAKPGVQKPGQK